MDNSGFGLRFTQKDTMLAKRIKAILDSFDFKMEGAKQVVEVAEALLWFVKLVPSIEANVFELLSETKPLPPPEVVKGKKGK